MSDGNLVNIPVPSVDSVTVAVRVRPFSQREKNSGSKCVISMHSRTTTTIQDPKNPEHRKTFTFDLAYWSHNGFQKDKDGVFISADPTSKFASQKDIFHHLGKGILDSAWQGYNATLLAYGQTGSGKSYSMVGFGTNKGIIPNVCEELFQAMEKREKNQECQVTFSMLEIYNEQIRDLLPRTKKPGGLKVREDQQLGFYVDGLTSVPCENYTQIERLMEQGTKTRTTASTNMNASSSRSHMVITIQFKQVFLDRGLTKQSTINLVDLAGSERQKSSGSEGDRLREGSQVNLSLTNLGNVISALADAATGKKVLHVPYRDSVLTKLLQPALGGNSRTTLIKAKKIRNKAMVNTSMLTRESKAENIRVPLAHGNFRMAEQPARPLAEPGPWARELAQAREEWQQQYMAIAKEQRMMETLPHLLNVNEDPQLTGVLKYFIQADKHASFTNSDGKVTVTPHSKCKVVINGVPIMTKTKLQHLDRIILGSNSAYLYIGFPSERDSEDLNRFDYDFFQLERAAAEGVSMDKLGAASHSDGKADPSVLAVFQDYVRLMPLVAEANQMGEELKKGLRMELKVKNLAASDSRGHELQKEVMVKVTNQRTHEVWIWSKAKFINRKFLMEELYQRFLDGEDSHVAQEDDPFWDPVEVIHLGSAHVWLQSLAYSMKFEEQVEFLNCDGKEEAVVHVHMTPCSPEGWAAKSAGLEYLRSLLMRPKGWKQKAFSIRGIGSHQFSVPFLKLSKLVHELVGLELIPDCEEFRKERDTLRGSILYPTGSPVLVAYHMERLCRGFFLQRLACGEEDVVIDPSELLGRRMDFQVGLVRGLGIKWLKEDAERGIQMGYRIYDLSSTLYSKPVWKTVNPQIEETVQFTALNASQEFLNYLQTNALIIDLWGLPEGCAQMNCSHPDLTVTSEGHIMVDTKKMSTVVDTGQTPSNQISELYMKLLKFERETELLRSVNRALREENAFLKQSIEKVGSTPQAHKLSDALKVTWTAARPPAAREASPVRTGPASSDREFAKALKLLYHSMNVARGQLLRLRQAKPPEEDEMLRPFVHQQAQRLKDFGDLLESSLWRLKTDVAVIVKKKRASLLQAQ